MDVRELVDRVEVAFVETGARTPGWPDPHPGAVEPAPEEYSRESDPGRYRIVGARVQAWARALLDTGLAQVDVLDDEAVRWSGRLPGDMPVLEVVRLQPTRAGAVPLLFATRRAVDAAATMLSTSVGDPAQEIDLVPNCGCDACDDGSAALLEDLDGTILDVVSGALVVVVGPDWSVERRRNGWRARGGGNAPEGNLQALTDAEAGRSAHPVISGLPWW